MIINNNIHICETYEEFKNVTNNNESPIFMTNTLAKFILWNTKELSDCN